MPFDSTTDPSDALDAGSHAGSDPGDLFEVIEGAERSVVAPVLDDALSESGPDAGQSFEFGRASAVHVDLVTRSPPGCAARGNVRESNVRGDASQHRFADPRHLAKVVRCAKAPRCATVRDDPLRQRRPDARESREFVGRGFVRIDPLPGRQGLAPNPFPLELRPDPIAQSGMESIGRLSRDCQSTAHIRPVNHMPRHRPATQQNGQDSEGKAFLWGQGGEHGENG